MIIQTDQAFNSIILVIAILFILAIATGIIIGCQNFSRKLHYINTEIKRTRGEEQKYWKQEKRRLLLSVFRFNK